MSEVSVQNKPTDPAIDHGKSPSAAKRPEPPKSSEHPPKRSRRSAVLRTVPWENLEGFQSYLQQSFADALLAEDAARVLKCLADNKIQSPQVLVRIADADIVDLGLTELGIRRAIQYVQDDLATLGFKAPPPRPKPAPVQASPRPSPPTSGQLQPAVGVLQNPTSGQNPHLAHRANHDGQQRLIDRAALLAEAQRLVQPAATLEKWDLERKQQLQRETHQRMREQAQHDWREQQMRSEQNHAVITRSLSVQKAPTWPAATVKLETSSPAVLAKPRTTIPLPNSPTVVCHLNTLKNEIARGLSTGDQTKTVFQLIDRYAEGHLDAAQLWNNLRLVLGDKIRYHVLCHLHTLNTKAVVEAADLSDVEFVPGPEREELFGPTCQICQQALTTPVRGPTCHHTSLFDRQCFVSLHGTTTLAECPVSACAQKFASDALVAIDPSRIRKVLPAHQCEVIEVLD